MLSIIAADWRRLLGLQVLGLIFWALIIGLSYWAFSSDCCPGEPERALFNLKILMLVLAYGQAPLVIWLQLRGRGMYRHHRILQTLPLSSLRLNLINLAIGGLYIGCGIATWVAAAFVWKRFGIQFHVWAAVFTGLMLFGYIFVSMRNIFPRVLLPVLFPLIVVPKSELILRPALEFVCTPLASLFALAAAVLLGWWALPKVPPRWSVEQ